MIVYVVYINIEKGCEEEWLSWMKNTHIPEIMNLKIFLKNEIFRIFHSCVKSPENYNSYCIKYYAKSLKEYHLYQKKYAKKIQEKHSNKYKNQFNATRQILELINEY